MNNSTKESVRLQRQVDGVQLNGARCTSAQNAWGNTLLPGALMRPCQRRISSRRAKEVERDEEARKAKASLRSTDIRSAVLHASLQVTRKVWSVWRAIQ